MKKIRIQKFSMKHLFSNNKFLFVISILIAIVLWMVFVLNSKNEVPQTINNVPIHIDTSGLSSHLSIIEGAEQTANVTISGKRLAVSQITKDDIQLTAEINAGYVTGAGTLPFNINAKIVSNKSGLDDVRIIEIDPKTIQITFDTFTSKEIPIQIDDSNISASDGYIKMGTLSDIENVVVSGPSAVLDRIDSAVATIDGSKQLSASESFIVAIKLYSKDGSEINAEQENIELNYKETRATVNIYKRAELTLNVGFTNQPTEYLEQDIGYTITHRYIEVAAPEDKLNETEFTIGTIDFRDIAPGSTFTFPVELPEGYTNIDNITEVTVTPDTEGLVTKQLDVRTFNVINVPSNKIVTVSSRQIADVIVVGDPNMLTDLTSDDLYAEISWNNISGSTGEVVVPVRIRIKQISNCWVYGKYEVSVKITDNIAVSSVT